MTEAAARKYCELMGLDPDEEVEHSPRSSSDLAVTAMSLWSSRWELVDAEIQKFEAMLTAIKSAREQDRKRSASQPVILRDFVTNEEIPAWFIQDGDLCEVPGTRKLQLSPEGKLRFAELKRAYEKEQRFNQ